MFRSVDEPKKRKLGDFSNQIVNEGPEYSVKPNSLLTMGIEQNTLTSFNATEFFDGDNGSSKSDNTPALTDDTRTKNSLDSVRIPRKRRSTNGDTLLNTEIEVDSADVSGNEITCEESFDLSIDRLLEEDHSTSSVSNSPEGKVKQFGNFS